MTRDDGPTPWDDDDDFSKALEILSNQHQDQDDGGGAAVDALLDFIALANFRAPDNRTPPDDMAKVAAAWDDLLKTHGRGLRTLEHHPDRETMLSRLGGHYGGKARATAISRMLRDAAKARKEAARNKRREEERERQRQLGLAIESGAMPAWEHLATDDNDKPYSDLGNVLAVLQHDPRWSSRLRFCEFGMRNEMGLSPVETDNPDTWGGDDDREWGPIGKNAGGYLRSFCSDVYGMRRVTARDADTALDLACDRSAFDPLTDYLNGVGEHPDPINPETFLQEFIDTDGADPEQLAVYSRVFLLSAVARAFRPGIKVDDVLVLLGGQGVGKSTMLKALSPQAGWVTDAPPAIGKTLGHQFTMGVWLYELAELDASLNERNAAAFKAWVSRDVDRYENKGANGVQDYARRCVFVGSTNVDEFNPDPTGNRRYMPVRVTGVDNEGIRECRDRIWAGAVQEYRRRRGGWFLTAAERERYQANVDTIDIEHPWMLYLQSAIRDRQVRPVHGGGYHMGDILRATVGGTVRGTEGQRMGALLRKAGWTKERRTVNGEKTTLWWPPRAGE